MVKRIFFAFWIFCVSVPGLSALESYSTDLTNEYEGRCIEDSHIGSNDCARVFSSNLTNGTYWQNDSSSGHWFGFEFFSFKKIAKYSVLNVNNDPTLKMRVFEFQAYSGSEWVTLDRQTGFDALQYGTRYEFSIREPIEAKKFRVLVEQAGPDGTLVTDVGMYELAKSGDTLSVDFGETDAQTVMDLLVVFHIAETAYAFIFFCCFLWVKLR